MNASIRKYPIYAASLLSTLTVAFIASEANAQTSWGVQPVQTTYANPSDSWYSMNWVGSSSVRKRWRLGIEGENSVTGVVVRQVESGSAAARINIVPGDIIVCVAGDQVGNVGNQIFDLQEELNQHADRFGRVQMLIYYQRIGQLRSLNVQLQDHPAGLTGTLAVESGRLPADAVVTIRLENVSRPFYVVRNGEYSFRASGYGIGDIPFQLNYDPAYISNNDTYRLRAWITSGGRTIYDTVQPPLVLTRGNPTTTRLLLRPVATQYTQANTGSVVTVGYNSVDANQQAIVNAYQRYLGRMPNSMEIAAWYQTGQILNDRMRRLSLELMATDEYYNRSGGNNVLWVNRVFTEIIGHPPTTTETDLWLQRFAELRYSRMELLNQLNMQARR
ncbi:YbaY family lipoprotein [Bremerella sp. P1]|uniref:YbaY family lipoprotein n=1 Tax=Bremerella sp. P1 TaxID=3026424 RepID=UPI002368C206|nr:YbaY family lipoprotein [Bremerella sp. P1]WDI43823.1 YbaY family lipoprotein [Bremerella sp. P1]